MFFHGPQPQQEIAVEIDPGKTLLVALQAIADEGEATRKVQFELNGQARWVHVPVAGAGGGQPQRRRADAADPWQVASPMPGSIVSVSVQPGQRVRAGDTLLALEAMKMEAHVSAERDARVEAVLVAAGDRVQARDLLILLAPPG